MLMNWAITVAAGTGYVLSSDSVFNKPSDIFHVDLPGFLVVEGRPGDEAE